MTAESAQSQVGTSLPDFQLAQPVAQNLDGLAVHPVTIVAQRAPTTASPSKLHFVLNGAGAYWAKKAPNTVFVVLPFEITVAEAPDTETQQEFGHFYLQYQVVYTLNAAVEECRNENLEAFVAFYGVNHVWPYCRADLQMLTTKVGLTPLTLPLMKIGQLPAGFSISHRQGSETETSSPTASEEKGQR